MIRELDLGGLFFAPWMGSVAIAFGFWFGLRAIMTRRGVYRWVWHPALFDMALFVVLVALVSMGLAFVES